MPHNSAGRPESCRHYDRVWPSAQMRVAISCAGQHCTRVSSVWVRQASVHVQLYCWRCQLISAKRQERRPLAPTTSQFQRGRYRLSAAHNAFNSLQNLLSCTKCGRVSPHLLEAVELTEGESRQHTDSPQDGRKGRANGWQCAAVQQPCWVPLRTARRME